VGNAGDKYSHICDVSDQEVDTTEAFLALDEGLISELIRPVGPRGLFKKRHAEFKMKLGSVFLYLTLHMISSTPELHFSA